MARSFGTSPVKAVHHHSFVVAEHGIDSVVSSERTTRALHTDDPVFTNSSRTRQKEGNTTRLAHDLLNASQIEPELRT